MFVFVCRIICFVLCLEVFHWFFFVFSNKQKKTYYNCTGSLYSIPVQSPCTESLYRVRVQGPCTGPLYKVPVQGPCTGSLYRVPVQSPCKSPCTESLYRALYGELIN